MEDESAELTKELTEGMTVRVRGGSVVAPVASSWRQATVTGSVLIGNDVESERFYAINHESQLHPRYDLFTVEEWEQEIQNQIVALQGTLCRLKGVPFNTAEQG